MKKIFTLLAAICCAASMFAGYGIAVNGKTYYEGTENPNPMDASFKEFMVLGLSLNAGDQFQLWDPSANDGKGTGWAVQLDGASSGKVRLDGDHYVCDQAACFDFYIKLKFNADQLYIGEGECRSPQGVEIGGGETPGDEPGDDPTPPVTPGEDDDINYYAIGWINGADHGEAAYDVYEDEFLFEDGKLTIDCRMGSYIAIKDHKCNYYYSRTETTIANTSVKFEWASGWSGGQKWAIPEGVNYIIMRSVSFKGVIELERVDKATYDAYHLYPEEEHQAIENTPATEKAHKMMVDGQLRIVRGDKIYDATGREL